MYENVFFFTHMIQVNKLFGKNRNMTDATDRQMLLWTEVSIKYGDLSPLLDDVKRDQLDVTVYLFILTTARFSHQNSSLCLLLSQKSVSMYLCPRDPTFRKIVRPPMKNSWSCINYGFTVRSSYNKLGAPHPKTPEVTK